MLEGALLGPYNDSTALQYCNILLSRSTVEYSTVLEAPRKTPYAHLSAAAALREAPWGILQEVSPRSRRDLNRLRKRLEALSAGSVVVLEDFCEPEDCWLSNSGLRLSRSPCTSVISMSRLLSLEDWHQQSVTG